MESCYFVDNTGRAAGSAVLCEYLYVVCFSPTNQFLIVLADFVPPDLLADADIFDSLHGKQSSLGLSALDGAMRIGLDANAHCIGIGACIAHWRAAAKSINIQQREHENTCIT
jgi:hypothetical protein